MTTTEHDQWCESEYEHIAHAYTPCDCDNRNELRRRGFVVFHRDAPPFEWVPRERFEAEVRASNYALEDEMRRAPR